MKKALTIVLLSFFSTVLWAYLAMTDDQIRQLIMQGSITEFVNRYGNTSCPCPYSPGKGGHDCGMEAAYYQGTGSVNLRCYPRDITDDEVEDYRAQYSIPRRSRN